MRITVSVIKKNYYFFVIPNAQVLLTDSVYNLIYYIYGNVFTITLSLKSIL